MADIPNGGNTGNPGNVGNTSNTGNVGNTQNTGKATNENNKPVQEVKNSNNKTNDEKDNQTKKKYTSINPNANSDATSANTNSNSEYSSNGDNDNVNNAKEVENANNDKETGNAGNNPLQEKELDVLDPEAKAKAQNEEKKSFKDRINDGKEKIDKAKDFKEKHFGNKDDESGKNEQENNQSKDKNDFEEANKNGEKGTEGQGNKEPSNNVGGTKNARGSNGGAEMGTNNATPTGSTGSAGTGTGTTSGAGAATGGTSGATGSAGTAAGGAGASGTSASAVGAGGTAGSSGAAMGAASTTGAAGATGASAAGAAGATAGATAGTATAAGASAGTAVATGVGAGMAVLWPVLLVILIIIILVGVIGFFTSIPGLMVGEIKEFAKNMWNGIQSLFTTQADAYVDDDNVIDLANYLEEMDYNLVGYGFVEPDLDTVELISDTYGYIDYTEVLEDYPYYEQRDGDSNYRYYNESGEAYDGYYYNSLGLLIDNSTGEVYASESDSTYIDKYGIYRSTTETNISGAGIVVEMSDVDTTLLRSYLLSDYRISTLRNDDDDILNSIFSNIKKIFGGYSSGWSKGLIKIYLANVGLATRTYNESLFNFVDDLTGENWFDSIDIDADANTMTIKKGYFNNSKTFEIDGWADRYGMSLEFLLSLHIGTMAPDLVYAMLQSFDTEVQVYLDTEYGAVDGGYVDLLNDEATLENIITMEDIKEKLETEDDWFFDISFSAILTNSTAVGWVLNYVTINTTNAQMLLEELPLESPSDCTKLKNGGTKCSDLDQNDCCSVCKDYVLAVINAIAEITDKNYSTYTPYIARVLGSWFRDSYFIIPEEEDWAIEDYKYENDDDKDGDVTGRTSAEVDMIENSYGDDSTLVVVDEEYLGETGEYWTDYEMKSDDEYQLYYLNPDGTTSDTTMEDFLDDNGYTADGQDYDEAQAEAEADGHAFVKKAETKTVTEVEADSLMQTAEEMEGVLWSAYDFDAEGDNNWIKLTEGDYDEDSSVQAVYDLLGDNITNDDEGGFYYKESYTTNVEQVEDAQRSETNATVKWLFKYRKYYIYDGTESKAMSIAEDKEAVLEWVKTKLQEKYGDNWGNHVSSELLGVYGRSALRQAYGDFVFGNNSEEDQDDVAEQWLEWQLDMYYSGITNGCSSSDIVITDDLYFIETTDDDGNLKLEPTNNESEADRIGDPRNPNLIDTVKIDKSSLEAFSILENTQTYAAEYAYRDFKELIVELNYFDKEDLSDKIESVFTWIIPDISNIGWPYRPYDKQNVDYGALIESSATYDFLEEIEYSSEETSSGFKGYQGGEYVVSPVTGKVVDYGTHERTNVYTGDVETVGYIEIEILDADGASAVSDYSLFYDEYEDVCDGYTVIIDGFNVDIDLSGGEYAQNEVYALYNTDEQARLEEIEQEKDDAPFRVDVNGDIYIKEGKYIGTTYTDSEASQWTTSDGEVGVANYIRIIVKDTDYTVIDDVEDFFNIEEVSSSSENSIYSTVGTISSDAATDDKIIYAMEYYISIGFREEAAAGIVGNLIVESSLDPTAANGSSYYGLAQWNTTDRWPVVEAWLKDNDYETDDFGGQLMAVYYAETSKTGMSSTYWNELKDLTNVEQATELFCVYYERCPGTKGNYSATEYYEIGTNYQGLTDRKEKAQYALDLYEDYISSD